MVLKVEKIIDYLFVLYIIATIIFPTSIIGKFIQLLFVFGSLILISINKIRITKFNILDLLFLIFTIIQYISGIAVMKSSSLSTSVTLFYNFLFSLAIVNYLLKKDDLTEFSELYAKTTLFSLIMLLLIYRTNLSSGRFDTSNVLYFVGGHSATSLSIIAAIPCFFLILFGENKKFKKNIIIVLILFIISILTGTRKTLIIFALIFLIVIPLRNKKINFYKVLKILIFSLIIAAIFLVMCFKNAMLYNIIGKRVEGVIYSVNIETNKIEDDSLRVRKRMILQAKTLISKKKYFGWGMDYFRSSKQNNLGYYSHNNFYEILIGGGIFGFIIYYLKYILLALSIFNLRKENKNMCFFLLLFFVIMVIIEYWQVTYIYRFILIYQSILISIIYRFKNNKKIVRGGEDNEN